MRQQHLIDEFNGPTVVWVDDRFLLSRVECNRLIDLGVKSSDLKSMDEKWVDAVQTEDQNCIDELEDDLIPFANAAIILKAVCKRKQCNLVLSDFKAAHQKWFRCPNALFLLDVQNLLKPLNDFFTSEDGAITDRLWNWDQYGTHCVLAYQIPKQQFRFFTRFRNDYSPTIAGILPTYFDGSNSAEQWAIRHNLIPELDGRFSEFIDSNQIHADPCIVNFLTWFRNLGLGRTDDHQCLGSGHCLEIVRNRFGKSFDGESAKALFLGGVNQAPSKDARHTLIPKSDFCAVFNNLDVEINTNDLEVVRLPCAPALPFVLGLRALIFEMRRCKRYLPPDEIDLNASLDGLDDMKYVLSLFLNEHDRRGQKIEINEFRNNYTNYVKEGRLREEQHMTRQLISDLTLWKLALNDQAENMLALVRRFLGCHHPHLLRGFDMPVLDGPNFITDPDRIEFIWKVKSHL